MSVDNTYTHRTRRSRADVKPRQREAIRKPPVNVGDVIEVQIVELSRRGDGIARVKGFIIFVPGTRPGDRVRVRIRRVGRTYAVGEVLVEEY